MNSLNKEDYERLKSSIADRFPRLSADESGELVREAIARALESAPGKSLASAELLERALRFVPALCTERLVGLRRGNAVATHDAGDTSLSDSLEPHRRSRKARPPHTPKGVVPVRIATPEPGFVDCARLSEVELPTPELVAKVDRIRRALVEPVLRGEALEPSVLRKLESLYDQHFELGPQDEWVDVLVRELELEARVRLSHLEESSIPNRKTSASRDAAGSAQSLVAEGRRKNPDGTLGPLESLPLVERQVRRVGNRVLVDLYAKVDGKHQFFAQETLVPNDTPFLDDDVASACRVIVRVQVELGRLPHSRRLPSWICDVGLVNWLVARIGFDGAGGQTKLSSEKIRTLIAEPAALAAEIERHGARVADRLDDAAAAQWERNVRRLSTRVRLGAGVGIDMAETPT